MKKRVFVALGLSNHLKTKIVDWENNYKDLTVRWISKKDLHVTIIPPWYEDDINIQKTVDNLESLSGKIEPFNIIFHEITLGPNSLHPRLIWAIGHARNEILRLKKNLEKTLQRLPESRLYSFHLTLARFKPEDFIKFKNKNIYEEIMWCQKIESFFLMQSFLKRTGASYEVLEEIPFK